MAHSSQCPWVRRLPYLSFSSYSPPAHIHSQLTSASLFSHTLTHIHSTRALLTHNPLRGGWAALMHYSGYCGDGWAAALGVHPVSRAIHMEAKNSGQVNGPCCFILCTLIMTWQMQGQPQLQRIIYTVLWRPDELLGLHYVISGPLCKVHIWFFTEFSFYLLSALVLHEGFIIIVNPVKW